MPRFAFRITEEVVELAAQLTGTDTTFPDDMFIIVEMVSETEFNAKLKTTDEVLEEYKKDTALQVI